MRSIKQLQDRNISVEECTMVYLGFRLDGTETEEEIDLIDRFNDRRDRPEEPDEDDEYYTEEV